MNVHFWGVRGSLPTPLTPAQLRSKISSIIQRVRPDDLASPENKEKFLASLPDYLFGAVGGNTPCVEISSSLTEGAKVVLDAGTGIREFGLALLKERLPSVSCHILFSHFHWDHVQGLPFFGPAFNPSNSLFFYSPVRDFRETLERQMTPPHFPITMETMGAHKEFRVLESSPFAIGGLKVSFRLMNHPGGCYAYAFEEGATKIIYSTDTELVPADFEKNEENTTFFRNASALIIDSQYTLGESIEKFNWGHSAFSLTADFAASWNIRNLILFHHEPEKDDKKVLGMLRSTRWYIDHLEKRGVHVLLAQEGMDFALQ
jgi:phosphoribosyl 1,2-cyclic phosphodiesterase